MKKRIVFIVPPVPLGDIYCGLSGVSSVAPPFNLLVLAAVVRNAGYDPYIIDCQALKLKIHDVIKRLEVIKPDFVGITAVTPHITMAARLSEEIKNFNPTLPIIVGGTHVSALPEETLSMFPIIDIGVIGEGEVSLIEILQHIERKEWLGNIKGIVFRDKEKLINTGIRKDTINLDSLPPYAWDLLEGFPKLYRPHLFVLHREPSISLVTSRGCSGSCVYCYSDCLKTIASYSADYIFNMFSHLNKKYGIREFMLCDDNFLAYRYTLRHLLKKMIAEKTDFTWLCNARPDYADKEIFSLMAKAGCWQILFGIETGNAEIMHALKRRVTKEQVSTAVSTARAAGMRTVGYFMLGHFGETPETIQETFNFAVELGLDDWRLAFFTPFPGTDAYRVARQYGEFEDDWNKMSYLQPHFVPKGFTKETLMLWHKRLLSKFFLRKKIIFSYIRFYYMHPLVALKVLWVFLRYVRSIAIRRHI